MYRQSTPHEVTQAPDLRGGGGGGGGLRGERG